MTQNKSTFAVLSHIVGISFFILRHCIQWLNIKTTPAMYPHKHCNIGSQKMRFWWTRYKSFVIKTFFTNNKHFFASLSQFSISVTQTLRCDKGNLRPCLKS